MYDIEASVNDFLSSYSNFERFDEGAFIHLSGLFHLNVSYQNILIEDYFDIEVIIDKTNENPPIVFEKRRIEKFHHRFTDGSLCLGIPMEISVFLKKNRFSIIKYFEYYIIPYLYGFLYYEKYSIMPFGERSHGLQGYLEYFRDIFGLSNEVKTKEFLIYLMNNTEYRGHHICPCGSGKKIRDCHKDVLFHYYNEKNEVVLNELKKYLEKTKHVKNKN